nr:LysR substrate-binding domain-containing protein [uncultured Brevundimonas sp.]
MELRLLRHFVAVADHLHFRQAAEATGVPQPLLSRSVLALERDLGARLFDRTHRRVELTLAGKLLLEEARDILARSAAVQRRIHQIADPSKLIRIGYVPSFAFGLLPAAIRRMRTEFPEVNFRLTETFPGVAMRDVADGVLDLALLHERPVLPRRVRCETLACLPFDAVVPSDWPLATQSSVRLADLADQPFVFAQPDRHLQYSALLDACQDAGFTPRVVAAERDTLPLLVLVASGVGMTFAHRLVGAIGLGGLTFLPVEGFPDALRATLAVAWPTRSATVWENRFREILAERIEALSEEIGP